MHREVLLLKLFPKTTKTGDWYLSAPLGYGKLFLRPTLATSEPRSWQLVFINSNTDQAKHGTNEPPSRMAVLATLIESGHHHEAPIFAGRLSEHTSILVVPDHSDKSGHVRSWRVFLISHPAEEAVSPTLATKAKTRPRRPLDGGNQLNLFPSAPGLRPTEPGDFGDVDGGDVPLTDTTTR